MSKRRKRWAASAKRDSPIRLISFKARRADTPGYSNPSCYAGVLGDCAVEVSQEHFMSFALLMGLLEDSRGIHVKGSHWGEHGTWVQPERLTSPILCSAHNEQLGPLDSFAADFERECRRIYVAARDGQVVSTITRYHGNNLERWMLKVLCGLVASGNARSPNGDLLTTAVPERWVRMLYGDQSLLAPCGLFVNGNVGSKVSLEDRFRISPITGPSGLAGLIVQLRSFEATLIAEPFSGTPIGALEGTNIRHPRSLAWTNGNRSWQVDFIWNDGPGPGVRMKYNFSRSDRAA